MRDATTIDAINCERLAMADDRLLRQARWFSTRRAQRAAREGLAARPARRRTSHVGIIHEAQRVGEPGPRRDPAREPPRDG